jgi:hypothetical protein
MLNDRPDEQSVLFKEIVYKKMTVREAERIARGIAKEKVRKHELLPDPEIEELETKLGEALHTRVRIDRKDFGGKLTIDFFSREDLATLVHALESKDVALSESLPEVSLASPEEIKEDVDMLDDRDEAEKQKSEEDADLYNISNFSL